MANNVRPAPNLGNLDKLSARPPAPGTPAVEANLSPPTPPSAKFLELDPVSTEEIEELPENTFFVDADDGFKLKKKDNDGVISQMGGNLDDTDDLAEGSTNLYFTTARAKAAAVANAITDSVTDVAPSQNAVFDALALKASSSHTHPTSDVTGFDAAALAASVLAGSLTNGETKAPTHDAVFDALALKASSSHTHTAADTTDFDAAALAASVLDDLITSGEPKAPSMNSVYAALEAAAGNVSSDGGYQLIVASGPVNLSSSANRKMTITPESGGTDVRLPDTTTLQVGTQFVIRNTSNADALTVQTSAGSPLTNGTIIFGTKVFAVNNTSVDTPSSWVQMSHGAFERSTNTPNSVALRDANGQFEVGTPTTGSHAATMTYADAKVADTITNGVSTVAPSQNAVFDALALKLDLTGGTLSGALSTKGLAPIAAGTWNLGDPLLNYKQLYTQQVKADTNLNVFALDGGLTLKSSNLAESQQTFLYMTPTTAAFADQAAAPVVLGGIATPVANTDAANKAFVTDALVDVFTDVTAIDGDGATPFMIHNDGATIELASGADAGFYAAPTENYLWGPVMTLESLGAISLIGTGVDVDGQAITNVADPTNAQDAATKSYVDNSSLAGAITHRVHVNKAGDDATANGSEMLPFLTIAAACTYVGSAANQADFISDALSRWEFVFGPGVWTETVTLPYRQVVILNVMSGALIVGNVTITSDAAVHPAAGQFGTKLILLGADLRSAYDGVAIPMTGISGNVSSIQAGSGNISGVKPLIQIINSGVHGNVTFDSVVSGFLGAVFYENAIITGDTVCGTGVGSDISVSMVAANSDTSSSKNLGGVSGKVSLTALRNCRFSRPVVASGLTGGRLHNVEFPTAAHNFTGMSGTLTMDANSYASYYAKVTTKGSETISMIDDAMGMKYTPATGADWVDADPTTIKAALDRLAAAVAGLLVAPIP